MLKNKYLRREDYTLFISFGNRKEAIAGKNSLKKKFIRIKEAKDILFSVCFYGEGAEYVFLHLNSGEKYEAIPLKKNGNMFEVSLSLPCRHSDFIISAKNGETIYWEPEEHHKILSDPPSAEGLKLYTLIPNASGTAAEWSRKLYEIKDMGFNAVHLLPITESGPSESPYSVKNFFKIDPSYEKEKKEFENFVKTAQALGIGLYFDIALNHASPESDIAENNAIWITPDPERNDCFKRGGCWNNNKWISWEDLVLINYGHPDKTVREDIWGYMKDYTAFWSGIAEKTGGGIRLDNLHSSDKNFIKWCLSKIKKEYPDLVILAEFFGSEETINEGTESYGLNLVTGNTWEYHFMPQLRDYFIKIHSNKKTDFFLSPVSHDTETPAVLFGSPFSFIPRYVCCSLMGTGHTGIVQNCEYGGEKKIKFIGKQGSKDIKGKYDFTGFIKKTNALLDDHPVFKQKGNAEFPYINDKIMLCIRTEKSSLFMIAANFDIYRDTEFSREIPDKYEIMMQEKAKAVYANGKIKIKLSPCGAIVLKFKGSQK